jgi:adenine deaminase
MQAFLTTGIRSDHVPHSAAEALEKLQAGMWVMFCNGPITKDLPDAIRSITETGISSRHASFCIDDLDTRDAVLNGHIDYQIRVAIASGLDPISAVQMATLNAAECHRMDHIIGSVSPGKAADILLVSNLREFRIERVIAAGRTVAEQGHMVVSVPGDPYPAIFQSSVRLRRPVEPDDLTIKVPQEATSAKVLVLEIRSSNPMRHRAEATLNVVDGVIESDVDRDILYCAMVERHLQTGNIGLGFVSGLGLHGGTMASSISSPTSNMMCLGSNPADMALAINHLAEIGGGQVLVRDGKIVEELPLPVAGCMADISPQEMSEREIRMSEVLQSWGCPIERAFLFLMMLEIVPLPHYALTEFGVVEFSSLSYVDQVLDVIS